MTPAVPLPLLVPVTSTTAPASNTSAAVSSWPTLVARDVVGAQLGEVPARRDARLDELAGAGLVTLRGSMAPNANCTAL